MGQDHKYRQQAFSYIILILEHEEILTFHPQKVTPLEKVLLFEK